MLSNLAALLQGHKPSHHVHRAVLRKRCLALNVSLASTHAFTCAETSQHHRSCSDHACLETCVSQTTILSTHICPYWCRRAGAGRQGPGYDHNCPARCLRGWRRRRGSAPICDPKSYPSPETYLTLTPALDLNLLLALTLIWQADAVLIVPLQPLMHILQDSHVIPCSASFCDGKMVSILTGGGASRRTQYGRLHSRPRRGGHGGAAPLQRVGQVRRQGVLSRFMQIFGAI